MINDENYLNQMRKYVLETKNKGLSVKLSEEVGNCI